MAPKVPTPVHTIMYGKPLTPRAGDTTVTVVTGHTIRSAHGSMALAGGAILVDPVGAREWRTALPTVCEINPITIEPQAQCNRPDRASAFNLVCDGVLKQRHTRR